MATPDAATDTRFHGSRLYFLYLASIAPALIGNLGIRMGAESGWLGRDAQAGLAVVSAAPLVAAAFFFWRLLRGDLDEMLQRIVLEGMAFALVIYVPAAALWMNLRAAGVWTPRLDAPDIVLTPALLVAIGIAIASRRFQ